MFILFSLTDIDAAAAEFLAAAAHYRVFAFSGTLGAGKTTFISALCRQLGVADHVSSPTFSLINEYHFQKNGVDQIIYHMDWYRLRDADEAINAGMEDCLMNPQAICLVEWPEQAPELLTMPHLYIFIEHTGEDSRELTAEIR